MTASIRNSSRATVYSRAYESADTIVAVPYQELWDLPRKFGDRFGAAAHLGDEAAPQARLLAS